MSPRPQHNNLDEKLSAIVGLVVGVLFMAGGFWVRQIDTHQRATLSETQGIVVNDVSRRERYQTTHSERETYAPVIEFLANGEPIRFTGNYQPYRLSKGHVVLVRYDPSQPESTARVVEPLEGLTAWGMFGVGGLSLILSLGALLPGRRWFSGE